MSGTSSEYQRGYDDGAAKHERIIAARDRRIARLVAALEKSGWVMPGPGIVSSDPVSFADARAESYRKGWADAMEVAAEIAEAKGCHFHDQAPTAKFGRQAARAIRSAATSRLTVPQALSQPPTPPETPEPATAQHSGSQAYQENDDEAS